jgi:ribosome-binding factor A
MSPRTRRSGGGGANRNYPRTARLNQLVQEIVAEEIERIEDDRLGLFTVVAVDVEADLRHAVVYYSALAAGSPGAGEGVSDADEDPLVVALAEHRSRLQSAIGRQARMKRTPELTFRPDTVVRQAQRIEEILQNVATEPTADELEALAPEPAAPDREA